jgi:N-acetylglucosaminyldiphosphoundecaprenol N-acetyl-beta-D-mannosaminyltransferase
MKSVSADLPTVHHTPDNPDGGTALITETSLSPQNRITDRFPEALKPIRFMDLSLLTGPFDDLAGWFAERILARPDIPYIVTHININNYCKLLRAPLLLDDLKSEGVLVMDGIGMKVGCFLLGLGWLTDLNGTDLFPLVMEKAAAHKLRLFLLGSEPRIAERAATVISDRYSGIEISGHHNGYFSSKEEPSIISLINDSDADILLVGRGFPAQEIFSLKHREALRVSMIWNVGGLFDFISGAKPRAPRLMRALRLEWLFRLVLEPKRMWRRNLVDAPHFFLEIIREMKGE